VVLFAARGAGRFLVFSLGFFFFFSFFFFGFFFLDLFFGFLDFFFFCGEIWC